MLTTLDSPTLLLVEKPDISKMQKVLSFGRVKKFIAPYQEIKSCGQLPVIPLFRCGAQLLEEARQKQVNSSYFALEVTESVQMKALPTQSSLPLIIRVRLNARNWKSIADQIIRVKPNFVQLEVVDEQESLRVLEKCTLELSNHGLKDKLCNTLLNLQTDDFTDWLDLEDFSSAPIFYSQITDKKNLSVVVPHFGSPHFLIATLWNLSSIFSSYPEFEVIVVDDGSDENDFSFFISTCQNFFEPRLNLRVYRWPKKLTFKNGEKVFRAGHSRNWGASVAEAPNILFLDSDMLAPIHLLKTMSEALGKSDFCQFTRYHIPNTKSAATSRYEEMISLPDLFIEEEHHWLPFFSCKSWSDLEDPWRFACSYGFGVSKELFMELGGFRRDFLTYGFEDTDLGYRLFDAKKKSLLIKEPLLHLTLRNKDWSSYLTTLKRAHRLRRAARAFYQINQPLHILEKWTRLLS